MLGTLLLTFIFPPTGPNPRPGDDGTPEFEAATKLIRQLGAARFTTREAAAKQLLEMRGIAIPALAVGTKSPDEEVRARCASLLPQVKAADWKHRAKAYLADPTGRHKDDPVLFADYEKAVGKLDDGARKLFAEMLGAESDLLALAVGRPEQVADRLTARCRALMTPDGKGYVPVRGKMGELATLFYLHYLQSPVRATWWGNDHLAYQLANPGLADGMAATDAGPALRRLVVRWAEARPADDTAAHQFFALAAGRQPIPEAVPLLTRLAGDPKAHLNNVRIPTVWALGRIGTPQALAALEGMLSDRTRVIDGSPKGICTLGDGALVALAQARGKAPNDYGLVTYKEAGIPLRATTGGEVMIRPFHWFADEGARQDGLKKWKADAEKTSPKAGR